MPIRKVHGGYKFGKVGKVYRTKKKAEKQMRAMYAHGLAEGIKDLPTFTNFINESEAVSNVSKSFEELKSGDKFYVWKANDREYIYEYTFQELEKTDMVRFLLVGTNSFTGNETFPLSQEEFHKSIVKIDINGKDVDLDNYKISDLKTLICVDKNEILDILRACESDIVK